jgi:outer membrane immunogenic protein
MRRLNLLLASAAAYLCFVGFGFVDLASAADIRPPIVRKAPAKAANNAPSFYVGVHGGYGWSRLSAPDDPENDFWTRGWLGGVQLGVNYQLNGFVIGAEGDFSLASIMASTSSDFGGGPIFGSVRHTYFATAAGRIGYAFGRTLPYVKGGAAWTRYKYSFDAPGVGNAFGTFTRTGWMIGLGVEQAFWDNISAKIEYNYLDFGNRTEILTTTGGLGADPADVKLVAHLVKLGLNYRFSLSN